MLLERFWVFQKSLFIEKSVELKKRKRYEMRYESLLS